MDCFVAFAPRNDVKTRLRDLAAPCVRVLRELCPSQVRGRGECRVPNAPAASCALWGSEYAHEYSQRRHRIHPAFPTQWFYGLYVLSPVTLVATVVGAMREHHRRLSACFGAPEPHDFAVRFKRRSSSVASASTASHPAFVTTRTPLLSRRDGVENTHFPIFRKENICARTTHHPITLKSTHEIRFQAHAIFRSAGGRMKRNRAKIELICPSSGKMPQAPRGMPCAN